MTHAGSSADAPGKTTAAPAVAAAAAAGVRPPVLMVHGLGSTFTHTYGMGGFDMILEDDGWTLLPISLPGHGEIWTPGDGYPDAATLIVDAARPHPAVHAIGFSAGAYALLVAAAREPALFASVTVLGVGDAGLAENRGTLPGAGDPGDLVAAITADTDDGSADMSHVIRRLILTAGNDPHSVAGFVTSTQEVPSLDGAGRITARALIVEGANDQTGSAEQLEKAMPHATRVVIRGADHFSLPADVRAITAVVDFLSAD